MNSSDLSLTLFTWLILSIWQIVFGSLTLKLVGNKLVDGGWAWGRLVGWLVISLVIWFGGHWQLPINTVNGIRLGTFVLLAIGGVSMIKNRNEIRKIFWEKKRLILVEELLFAGGLFWLTWVRGFNPAILDLEKFMDAGFMQGYLRSPTLPAMDMWLAGEKINYYTFGHFMGAVLAQLWGIDIAYSYNLLLGVIMGLTLSLTFSVTVNLIMGQHPRGILPATPGESASIKTILGGLVAAILMGFGGNTHAIWYLLKNHNWQGYWYADATRFIYHTIHEFPAYSFVVSDLHGHVWDLPVVLLFLGLLTLWVRTLGQHPRGIHPATPGESASGMQIPMALGVLFGVMAMTNTWDVLIYGMLTGIVGLILLIHPRGVQDHSGGVNRLLQSWAVMAVCGTLVALPFALNFVDIGQGVRLVTLRSPLWQMAVLWFGHLLVSIVALGLAIRSENRLVIAMVLSAITLLIIPELVYVKDIYPDHPRANTMFKLTYQAFVMMTILIGWTIAQIHPRGARSVTSGVLKILLLVITVAITGGLMVFPYFAYRDYYGSLKTYKSLDGLAWMAKENPDDFAAILWMKKNIEGRPVILEAVGESYTQHGRFSVFTGLPTVLGWRVHEWLWRGSFEIPGKRTEEVRTIYENPESEMARELIRRYQIRYIVVGTLERQGYKVDKKGLEKLGEVVFQAGLMEIVEINS